MVQFILASGSPRRKELLEQVGIQFRIEAAHGEEIITKTQPSDIVEELSFQKATEVADRIIGEAEPQEDIMVVIGADTIVALGDQIMGKPEDEEDAMRMLSSLQDNIHQVYTGVTLVIRERGRKEYKTITFYEKTDVEMYPMSRTWIERYIASKEPMDKAGAYAIQGQCAAYIKGICGEYVNVVGLPVARLIQELMKVGIEV